MTLKSCNNDAQYVWVSGRDILSDNELIHQMSYMETPHTSEQEDRSSKSIGTSYTSEGHYILSPTC